MPYKHSPFAFDDVFRECVLAISIRFFYRLLSLVIRCCFLFLLATTVAPPAFKTGRRDVCFTCFNCLVNSLQLPKNFLRNSAAVNVLRIRLVIHKAALRFQVQHAREYHESIIKETYIIIKFALTEAKLFVVLFYTFLAFLFGIHFCCFFSFLLSSCVCVCLVLLLLFLLLLN